jgi:hypothetical protein
VYHPGKVWVRSTVVHPPLERVFHIVDHKGKVNIDFTSFENLLANGDVAKATVIASLLAYVGKLNRQDNGSLALSAICVSSSTKV